MCTNSLLLLAFLAFFYHHQTAYSSPMPEAESYAVDIDDDDYSPEILSKKEVCPESNHFYHSETEKCYAIGWKGPCGENMIFTSRGSVDDDALGICVCNNHGTQSRYLAYDEETETCHSIYTKANCKSNREWLVPDPDDDDKLKCTRNPCRSKSLKTSKEFIPFGKECVELHSSNSICPNFHTVGFEKGYLYPKCIPNSSGYSLSLVLEECIKPSVRSLDGTCKLPSSINWNE